MNLGRKRYRRPVCFLKYYCQSGNIEHYRLSKQGFKKIEESFNQIPNVILNEKPNQQPFLSGQIQNNLENDLNSQFKLPNNQNNLSFNNQHERMNFLQNSYDSINVPNQMPILLSENPPLINNDSKITSSKDYYSDSQSNMSSDESVSSNEQFNSSNNLSDQPIHNEDTNQNSDYSSEGAESFNYLNGSTQENSKTIQTQLEDDIISQPPYIAKQRNQSENESNDLVLNDNANLVNVSNNSNVQQVFTSGFDDQTLYNKIMSDNLILQLKEFHFIKPDEIIVLYKITT